MRREGASCREVGAHVSNTVWWPSLRTQDPLIDHESGKTIKPQKSLLAGPASRGRSFEVFRAITGRGRCVVSAFQVFLPRPIVGAQPQTTLLRLLDDRPRRQRQEQHEHSHVHTGTLNTASKSKTDTRRKRSEPVLRMIAPCGRAAGTTVLRSRRRGRIVRAAVAVRGAAWRRKEQRPRLEPSLPPPTTDALSCKQTASLPARFSRARLEVFSVITGRRTCIVRVPGDSSVEARWSSLKNVLRLFNEPSASRSKNTKDHTTFRGTQKKQVEERKETSISHHRFLWPCGRGGGGNDCCLAEQAPRAHIMCCCLLYVAWRRKAQRPRFDPFPPPTATDATVS